MDKWPVEYGHMLRVSFEILINTCRRIELVQFILGLQANKLKRTILALWRRIRIRGRPVTKTWMNVWKLCGKIRNHLTGACGIFAAKDNIVYRVWRGQQCNWEMIGKTQVACSLACWFRREALIMKSENKPSFSESDTSFVLRSVVTKCAFQQ